MNFTQMTDAELAITLRNTRRLRNAGRLHPLAASTRIQGITAELLRRAR